MRFMMALLRSKFLLFAAMLGLTAFLLIRGGHDTVNENYKDLKDRS